MKLNQENIQRINTYLNDLLKECNKGKSTVELATSLTNAITEMKEEDEAIKDMKKYEYQCEIELYPLVQYIEANSAEEAIEEMERQIEDTAFMQDLDGRDFHCETARQVKMTKEYKEYVKKRSS